MAPLGRSWAGPAGSYPNPRAMGRPGLGGPRAPAYRPPFARHTYTCFMEAEVKGPRLKSPYFATTRNPLYFRRASISSG